MKSTKRALISSLICLMLCVSMLIGSTFAWFTDSASTKVNSIQSGRLEVDLVDATGTTLVGQTLEFEKAAGAAAGESVLWEPGCTYALPEMFVVNKGDLHLKYQIVITGITGDAKLNEVIDWTVQLNGSDLTDTDASLAPGATSGPLTVTGHMAETAGNEYQGLTIQNISVTVFATQDNVEFDSLGQDYDAFAGYESKLVKATGSGRVYNALDKKESSTNRASIYLTSKSLAADSYLDFTARRTAKTADSATYEVALTDSEGNDVTLLKKNEMTLYIPSAKEDVSVTLNGTALDAADIAYVKSTGQVRIKTTSFGTFKISWRNLSPSEEAAYNFSNGGTTLSQDITMSTSVKVYTNKNYNLEKTFTFTGAGTTYPGAMNFYGTATTVPNVTLNGAGGITAETGYAIHVGTSRAANVTINGGTYLAPLTAINCQKGTVTINGGFFGYTKPLADTDTRYLLNCIDANYANGTAKIIVKGGTFVNFNPADNAAEGAGTSFVAEGYKVESALQTNGDTWYTVVAE